MEGPRYYQFEDVLRCVQKAPDDIHWTTDRTEFDELIAMKKDSVLGPLEFHMVLTDVRGDWAPSSF